MDNNMRPILLFICSAILCSCTSSLPIKATGETDEYVVIARNSAAIFSSLELAQKEAVSKAMAYCRGMGKNYVKKYAIDQPMAIGQVPESTLYFICSSNNKTALSSDTSNKMSDSVQKLEDLNTMLKKGLITKQEYDSKKQEILNKM